MRLKHPDWQRRIIFEDAVYFVTSNTYNNYPYFREKIFCDLFVEDMMLCKRLKGFLLYAWVLNYDHFHLLFQPNDKCDISKVMQFVKRHVARNMNIVMGFENIIKPTECAIGNRPASECAIGQSQVQGEIHRFDKFVFISKIRFKFKYRNQNPFPKFQWHKSYFDHYIRNDRDFNDKLEYIAYNPEKHGLPDDWPYVFTNPKYENLTDDIL